MSKKRIDLMASQQYGKTHFAEKLIAEPLLQAEFLDVYRRFQDSPTSISSDNGGALYLSDDNHDRHHVAKRSGRWLLCFLYISRETHNWVHDHPDDARQVRLLMWDKEPVSDAELWLDAHNITIAWAFYPTKLLVVSYPRIENGEMVLRRYTIDHRSLESNLKLLGFPYGIEEIDETFGRLYGE